eukprot:TRINITY_DN64499_c0_g1_i1.p2 TRINITY_DN64499_c0_g1~~TRINITY_DN64499_c0_g1_i1.p2  ORF type:complete len:115 (+),score=18.45 TRINITY_DN64499_c0_g1_i1:360-704(+)
MDWPRLSFEAHSVLALLSTDTARLMTTSPWALAAAAARGATSEVDVLVFPLLHDRMAKELANTSLCPCSPVFPFSGCVAPPSENVERRCRTPPLPLPRRETTRPAGEEIRGKLE